MSTQLCYCNTKIYIYTHLCIETQLLAFKQQSDIPIYYDKCGVERA